VGEMVNFPSNGETATGYLAVPAAGPGPGVVVIQEWWGLVPHIKDVCERLAAAGFTALAVDLYHGRTTTEPDEAGKLMMGLELDRARREMGGAVRWLVESDRSSTDRVGCVGFCMGGGLALLLACDRPEVAADVTYYGVIPWPGVEPDFRRSQAAFLGHWGEIDAYNPKEKVDALERQIREAGRPVEFFWYPGCDHAFFNDTRPEVYNPEAARLSWERTLTHFRRHLGG
jgi:carboxymethylenebutenolidase